ncbi:MAG TPA: lipopolysaccharide transport periplasmic protein LptA [Steroidobacteraceae bacterium]|nr:lipopolysaccharide transport periplasmic protein LptA [Steroidobacteraceae bacterium]
MASSPRNDVITFRAALALGLLGLSQGTAAATATSCANAEIVLDARSMEAATRTNDAVLRDVVITQCDMRIQGTEARVTGGLNFENGQLVMSGDVRISAEGGHITSDKAVVSFRNRLVSQAIITGSPAQFEQKRDDGSISRGRAGTIDYQTVSGTVSLTDDAWLTTDGKNEISAKTLVYNIRTQSFQGRPKANSPERTGTGRIRIVIPAREPGEKEAEKKP